MSAASQRFETFMLESPGLIHAAREHYANLVDKLGDFEHESFKRWDAADIDRAHDSAQFWKRFRHGIRNFIWMGFWSWRLATLKAVALLRH